MTDTETTTPTETPEVEAAVADDAPKSAKLSVRRVKSVAPVVAAEIAENDPVIPEGTRTETDAGPVQGTNFLGEPREIEELEFPGLKITRQRF